MRATVYVVTATTRDGPHGRFAHATKSQAEKTIRQLRRDYEGRGEQYEPDSIEAYRLDVEGPARDVYATLATYLLDSDSSVEIHGDVDEACRAKATRTDFYPKN